MTTKYFVYPWAVQGGNTGAISDPAVDPVLSYQHGFTVNYEEPLTTSGALPVPRPQFNQLMLDITSNLQAWQQQGVYPFITSSINGGTPFPYIQGALCSYDAGDGNGVQIWFSEVAANTAVPGSDATKWRSLSGAGVPIGTMIEFGGAAAPANYVLCNGAIVSQTGTYAALYAAIGDAYANPVTPPGTGNFNLPDFRRTVAMGSGGTAGTAPGVVGTTVGSRGGEESHVQAGHELAAHTHNGTGSVQGADDVSGGNAGFSHHASSIGSAQSVDITTVTTGSSDPFNVTQPSLVVTKCIKYQ